LEAKANAEERRTVLYGGSDRVVHPIAFEGCHRWGRSTLAREYDRWGTIEIGWVGREQCLIAKVLEGLLDASKVACAVVDDDDWFHV
jgi:hypothetical protein